MCVDGAGQGEESEMEREEESGRRQTLKLVDVIMQETHRPRRADPVGSGES